jgi:hypothetical protein
MFTDLGYELVRIRFDNDNGMDVNLNGDDCFLFNDKPNSNDGYDLVR